jgi:hypothetical protein
VFIDNKNIPQIIYSGNVLDGENIEYLHFYDRQNHGNEWGDYTRTIKLSDIIIQDSGRIGNQHVLPLPIKETTLNNWIHDTFPLATDKFTKDENTLLLSHFDDGTFTDDVIGAWTKNGNATISTDVKKFGNSSLYLDGTTDTYLSIPINDTFNFKNNDFTIEYWEYRTINADKTAIAIQQSNTDDTYSTVELEFTRTYNNAPRFWIPTSGSWSGTIPDQARCGNLLLNQWVHRALVRHKNAIYAYENGKLYGVWYSTNSLSFNSNSDMI